MITECKAGYKYRIVGNRAGHGFMTGAFVYATSTLTGLRAGSHPIPMALGPTEEAIWNVFPEDVDLAWANRKEHAEFVKEEIKVLEKKIKELTHTYDRLNKFESDEEEIASLLVTALSEEGNEKERVKNLAKLLKGRLRTDLL